MPNMITVLNIADAKASSQGAAIADEDNIQFDSSFGNHRITISSEKTENVSGFTLACLRVNRPITLKKTDD